jgi:V8-like Glu-specific endopeptidase
MLLFRISALCVLFSLIAAPCCAKIYKYKKDGVWHYTDSPPREMLKESEEMIETGESAPAPTAGGTPLLTEYPARNAIEKATAATVAIKGSLGFGSGFFISKSGHILTNKHVVRTTESREKDEKKFFGRMEGEIEQIKKQFADEKKRLDSQAQKLEKLKSLAENEKTPLRKKSYEDEYTYRKKAYDEWLADYEKRLEQFHSEEKVYRDQRSEYDYGKVVGNLSRSFTIILADNTELHARLVATSSIHDLALLKLDGYQTPALKILDTPSLFPGLGLYAIGSPAKLTNSVTSGVFSGFENDFIQTNAQIYPGNSGGPLVTEFGAVVGINTFKKLTRKFEGLGFAIPIRKALQEFRSHLP